MPRAVGRKKMRLENHGRLPRWLASAAQGITYWIGHRRSMYYQHDLTEGAIVGELCNLIQANLKDTEELHCEKPFTKLVKDLRLGQNWGAERVDLVVVGAGGRSDYVAAIEVKRANSSRSLIVQDLRKLAFLKKLRPTMRTFLVLVSQGKRPKLFVNDKGRATQVILKDIRARTRRVFCSLSVCVAASVSPLRCSSGS